MVCGAIAALASNTPVFAQVRQFDVLSEDAGRSIPEFARQAEIQVIAPGDQLHGIITPPIIGAYDVFAALDLMLKGTDLKVSRSTGKIVTIFLQKTSKPEEREEMSPKNSTSVMALFFSIMAGNVANAQTQAAESIETVTVTGTSIRGAVAPVGTAVLGISAEAIHATAPTDAEDLLSNVPQLGSFGANAEQSTPNHWRTAGYDPNIHNLGIYATLSLVNGHRIAPTGGEAVLPDPSIVPVIALQRVDVLASGASAVYGSDAIAGVVNFIYRRNFDGLEATATDGFSDTNYAKKDFSLLAGHSWGSGNVMAAYEYSQTVSPLVSQIPFLALGGDQTSRGGRDLRSTNCLNPNVIVNGQNYAYNNGDFTLGTNKCGNLDPKATVLPNHHRNAALVTARQELNDRVSVYAEVNYSNYQTQSWGGEPSLSVTIPTTSPYFQLPPGVNATSELVTRSGLGLFPSQNITQYDKFFGVTLGVDINLGGDWLGNVMATSSITNDFDMEPPNLDMVAASALAAGTTPSTAFNPFGQAADNDPGVLAQINDDYTQENKSSNRLRELVAKANGTAFSLPGGDAQLAFGIDFQQLQTIEKQTAGPPSGPSLIIVRNDNISRTVMSGFVEANIPIIGQANALPGVQSLMLSIAGRADYYTLYGTIFNPKYGLNWVPVDGVTLKASYGTSFAAPNLGMTTSTFTVPRPNSAINLTDAASGIYLGTVNMINPGGGNPDLKPETANSKSFGIDYAPDYIPGLHLSTTYYEVHYKNQVQTPSMLLTFGNPQFSQFRIINPTQAQIDALVAKDPLEAPITTSINLIAWANAQNLGETQVAGFDIDGSYSRDLGSYGVATLGLVANIETQYNVAAATGLPFSSSLGTEVAPEYKFRWNLGWNFDPVNLNLFANYVSGFRNTTVRPMQAVDSNLTFDLSASLDLSSMFGHQVSLQGNIFNLFDKEPPFYDNGNGYYSQQASPYGRLFQVTLRAQL